MKVKISLYTVLFALLLTACASKKDAPSADAGKKPVYRPLDESQRMEVDFLFFNAQKEKLIGNYGVAENLFLEIIKRDPGNALAHYEIARTSIARQQFERALEYGRKASAMEPGNEWYLRLESDLLRQTNRFEEAIPVLQRLAEIVEDKESALFDLAMVQGEAKKYNDAIKTLNTLEARTGPSPELADQKRQLWLKLGKPDKALEEIRKLAESQPENSEYKLYLGQLYFEKGDFENALRQFELALKQEPENGKIILALADVYRARKENDKAFSYLERAFSKPDLDIDLKIQVLLTLFSEMDKNPAARTQALALGKETTRLHPEEPKAWAMYADLLYHSDMTAEAKVAYQQAIATDKGNQKFTVWQQYLLALLDVQEFALLSTEGDKAVDLFPNQALPYFLSGLAKNQLKDYTAAVSVLEAGVFYVSGNRELEASFYSSLGDAQNELKNFAASDASYTKSLAIQPDNALVLNNWSYYLSLRKDQLSKAEEMIQKAVKLEPKNPSYLDTYAWVMYQQARYKEALEWMELALSHAGDDRATLYEHYGDILFRLGDETKAMEYWRKAKEAGMESDFIDRKIADGKLYE